jgi:hypothetical protein
VSEFLIYGLVDPQNGEIRYVGQSSVGLRRPNLHLKRYVYDGRSRKLHVYRWIKSLVEKGLTPEVRVLEEVQTYEELNSREIEWIRSLREQGARLTNLTLGAKGRRCLRSIAKP